MKQKTKHASIHLKNLCAISLMLVKSRPSHAKNHNYSDSEILAGALKYSEQILANARTLLQQAYDLQQVGAPNS